MRCTFLLISTKKLYCEFITSFGDLFSYINDVINLNPLRLTYVPFCDRVETSQVVTRRYYRSIVPGSRVAIKLCLRGGRFNFVCRGVGSDTIACLDFIS